VKRRKPSVGSRAPEFHYEEKELKAEGVISLTPGIHEKKIGNDSLYPYLELLQVLWLKRLRCVGTT